MSLPDSLTVTPPVLADDLAGIGIIRKLVAFPTVSRDSNLGLIEWTRDYLARFGATTSLTYDDTRRKANLFATFVAQARAHAFRPSCAGPVISSRRTSPTSGSGSTSSSAARAS